MTRWEYDRHGRPWEPFEDETLRENAGKLTAGHMAHILCRPISGVHHRMKKLGLKGYQTGEHHWAARITSLQAAMIGALKDAGFSGQEIKRAFDLPVAVQTINDIGACRTWKQ